MSRNGAGERRQALPDLRQVAGDQQQLTHGADVCSCLRGDDSSVAVGDHDGRLVAAAQHLPDRDDVLGQTRTARPRRIPCLTAAGQQRRRTPDTPLLQQLARPVPPPRPVPHARPVHEYDPHDCLRFRAHLFWINGRRSG
jgi:hypothetical protein